MVVAALCVTDARAGGDWAEHYFGIAGSASDAQCNANGVPEPGEQLAYTLALSNAHPMRPIVDVVVWADDGNHEVRHHEYGTIAPLSSVARTVPYTVAPGTPCGRAMGVSLSFSSTDLVWQRFHREAIVTGVTVAATSESFDGALAPALPDGWTVQGPSNRSSWVVRGVGESPSYPNRVQIDGARAAVGALTTPPIPLGPGANRLHFTHRFSGRWLSDLGGRVQMSTDGVTYTEIDPSDFAAHPPEHLLDDCAGGGTHYVWNPEYDTGFVTSILNVPASAAGETVRFRWRFVSCTGEGSWEIDDVQVVTASQCAAFVPCEAPLFGDGFE